MKNEVKEKEYWELDPEWKESTDRPGYRMKTVYHGKIKIEIYRPILTPEERKKREAQVVRELEAVLRQYYREQAELEASQNKKNEQD